MPTAGVRGVMDWSELERRQPGLASFDRLRLPEPGVVLVATIRGDGTPRVSPVEPFVQDGVLWLSMLWQSRKAADLLRDPHVLVHSVITSRNGSEGEFKIRGTARAEGNPEVWRRYAAAVSASLGWSPEPGRFYLSPARAWWPAAPKHRPGHQTRPHPGAARSAGPSIPTAPAPQPPSTRRVCSSASAAHSAIAVNDRAPATTAHNARPTITASR